MKGMVMLFVMVGVTLLSGVVLSEDESSSRKVDEIVTVIDKILDRIPKNNAVAKSRKRPVSVRNVYLTRDELEQLLEYSRKKGEREGYKKGYRCGYRDGSAKKQFDDTRETKK